MFRESSAIDSERTAASVRSLYKKYAEHETWFTGTPDSVDLRIAQAKKIANIAKQASVRLSGRNAASQYIALAAEMGSDISSLEGLRRDILTAAMDRESAIYLKRAGYGHGPADHGGHGPDGGPAVPESYWDHDVDEERQEREREREDDEAEYRDSLVGLHDPERYIPEGLVHSGRIRSTARHFVAEQECDDLPELTIRAQRHAERSASTMPVGEFRKFVAAFVAAAREAYESPRTQRTASAPTTIQDFDPSLLFMD